MVHPGPRYNRHWCPSANTKHEGGQVAITVFKTFGMTERETNPIPNALVAGDKPTCSYLLSSHFP